MLRQDDLNSQIISVMSLCFPLSTIETPQRIATLAILFSVIIRLLKNMFGSCFVFEENSFVRQNVSSQNTRNIPVSEPFFIFWGGSLASRALTSMKRYIELPNFLILKRSLFSFPF